MAADPVFAVTPKRVAAQLTLANTARDGTGSNIVTVYTAPAGGARVFFAEFCAQVTTTAGVVRTWVHDGTNFRLYDEVLVRAITPSTSIKVWRARIDFPQPFVLPSGFSIRCATNNAEAINVHLEVAEL